MTKQRVIARQPASIHAKIRRAPAPKPVKLDHRPPQLRRSGEGSGPGAEEQKGSRVSRRSPAVAKRSR